MSEQRFTKIPRILSSNKHPDNIWQSRSRPIFSTEECTVKLMFLEKKKYRVININSTSLTVNEPESPDNDVVVVVASRERVSDYTRETFLLIIGLYCRPISLTFAPILADMCGVSSTAIRFHGPKYLAGETRGLTDVFIDPRHLRPMFYDLLEVASAAIARKSRRRDDASCREVLIARHKILQLLSPAIKQNPREITTGNANLCTRYRPLRRSTATNNQDELAFQRYKRYPSRE